MEVCLIMSAINTENASQKTNERCSKWKKCIASKTIRLYVLVFALIFSVCCLSALSQMTNSKSVTITINSASVSKGQNPDGSAFDIYKILSDEVLQAASEKLGGRISADELKLHLSVSDALTAETNQQLKQSILDGEYENIYFPTVYRLTYETVSDRISQKGILQQMWARFEGLFFPAMGKVLKAVAESYQQYYEMNYLSYDAMFRIDWENIDTMDYYNKAEALRTETMRVLRFLQDKSAEKRSAASRGSLNYSDLENDLWQLSSVDIENYQAYIVQNNLTTDRDTLLRQFRYMEEIYIEEKERKTDEYLILDDAVDMYDSTTTKVVFIPALDQDNSFYMNRTKVGLDYLVERADEARLAADEAEHNAQYYQYLQTCFADAVTPKQTQITHADTVYQNIKGQVKELNESVRSLLSESNQTENEGIKVSKAQMSVGVIGIGMRFAKQFVFLSMAAYILICMFHAFVQKKRADSQEV